MRRIRPLFCPAFGTNVTSFGWPHDFPEIYPVVRNTEYCKILKYIKLLNLPSVGHFLPIFLDKSQ